MFLVDSTRQPKHSFTTLFKNDAKIKKILRLKKHSSKYRCGYMFGKEILC